MSGRRLSHETRPSARDDAEQVARAGLSGPPGQLPFRDRLQPLFGSHDLGSVRVHVDDQASTARRRLGSDAYTWGEAVVLPSTATIGLVAHEAVHVVQQRGGRALGGLAAEAQAERLSADVVSGRSVASSLGDPTRGAPHARVLHRAPNQRGTTDPSYVVGWVRTREAAGGTAAEILDDLSKAHGGNSDRYFYTRTYGWVDIRHFGAAASIASGWGSVTAEGLGFANEAFQWAMERNGDYRSGFSPEDIPSNAAGASFGDDYVGSVAGESTADALARWMRDHGAVPAADPAARRSALPTTDPAVLGGADRGSSNVSRTQSTASGRASESRAGAERSVAPLADPWAWARYLGAR